MDADMNIYVGLEWDVIEKINANLSMKKKKKRPRMKKGERNHRCADMGKIAQKESTKNARMRIWR